MTLRFAIFALVLSTGCTTWESVNPQELKPDSWEDLLVFTQDGRIIEMPAGDYSFVHFEDSTILRGRGREIFVGQRIETRLFTGEVNFNSIVETKTRQRSFLGYTLPIMVGWVAIFWLFFLLGFRNPAGS